MSVEFHEVIVRILGPVPDWCLRRIEVGEPYRYSFIVGS